MERSLVEMTPTRQLALRFISGKFQGSEYALSDAGEMLVGRSGDVQIVLSEDMVSRRHARIQFDGQRIQIEDLGSTNGTYLNRTKVQGPQVMRRGDRLQVGNTVLELV